MVVSARTDSSTAGAFSVLSSGCCSMIVGNSTGSSAGSFLTVGFSGITVVSVSFGTNGVLGLVSSFTIAIS